MLGTVCIPINIGASSRYRPADDAVYLWIIGTVTSELNFISSSLSAESRSFFFRQRCVSLNDIIE